ncbi:MAG: methyltransferase domain-containing protein [Pseudonocardiaceae bacterium]
MDEKLVDELSASGHLTPEWRSSFLAVARPRFIPDTIWRWDKDRPGPDLVPVHRAEHPDQWRELAEGDDVIVIQVDDGHPVGPGEIGEVATSSASMPLVVALMLKHLDVHQGHRVLEIGTGTGYNAALLAHRLGADHVITIEIDPEVAIHARKTLLNTGYGDVTTVVGDGALGYPPGAPYDRLIATAACQWVPYPWVAQTRPGGRIVTPWGMQYYNFGLLALTVNDDGTATGQIVDSVSFMWLRDQRIACRAISATAEQDAPASVTETSVHPAEVANAQHLPGACIAIGTRVHNCRSGYIRPDTDPHGEGVLWLVDHESDSWAQLRHHPDNGGRYRVHQFGPRKLWDEVEIAYRWWIDQGKPGADRWRFTVTPEGQRIELISA